MIIMIADEKSKTEDQPRRTDQIRLRGCLVARGHSLSTCRLVSGVDSRRA
jgi:hypothetical protein